MRSLSGNRAWGLMGAIALSFASAAAFHVGTAKGTCVSMTNACYRDAGSGCMNNGCQLASYYDSLGGGFPCNGWTGPPPQPNYNYLWPTAVVGGPWPRCTQMGYNGGACTESLTTCMTLQEYITTTTDYNNQKICAMLCGSYGYLQCQASTYGVACQ